MSANASVKFLTMGKVLYVNIWYSVPLSHSEQPQRLCVPVELIPYAYDNIYLIEKELSSYIQLLDMRYRWV